MSEPLIPTVDDVAHFNQDYMKDVAPQIRRRILIERAIVRQVTTDLIAAGFELRLHDGEDWCGPHTKDIGEVMKEIMATDIDTLHAYGRTAGDALKHFGWVQFVYGNDGWDVISNNTVNLEPYLAGGTALANKFEGEV